MDWKNYPNEKPKTDELYLVSIKQNSYFFRAICKYDLIESKWLKNNPFNDKTCDVLPNEFEVIGWMPIPGVYTG